MGACPGRRGWGAGLVEPGEGAASEGPNGSPYQCLKGGLQGCGARLFLERHDWGTTNRDHKLEQDRLRPDKSK